MTETHCAKTMYRGYGITGDHCVRKGVLKHGGKLWCRQHYPPNVEAKRAAREKKWDAEIAETRRQHQIEQAKADVIAAAKAWSLETYSPKAQLALLTAVAKLRELEDTDAVV